MPLELHTWKIPGDSALLQNNPAGTMGVGDDGGMKAGKKKYDDTEEAAIRTYKNADGLFVHPTAAFRSGILVAAGGRKIGKKAARTIIAGALFPSEAEAILLNEKGKPIKEYTIHKCRVVVNGRAVMRCRPMFWPWSLLLAMEVDRDLIANLALVTDVLNLAGRIVGIGDNRPDTSKGKTGVGTFGRYSAELVS